MNCWPKKVAIVERFKQESMYGLSAKEKCGHCGEVAVSGGSIILHFFLLVLWRKLQEFYPIFFVF